MEIRLMGPYEYELSKRLWLKCFQDDGKEFVDYYYAERTKPEYALGAFPAGQPEPVAMLHMLPMRMRFGEELKDVCFVAGVCTDPKLRRRGYCRELFEAAFKIMGKRGFSASVLQPFDTAFYERLGYRSYAYRRVYTLSDECAKCVGRTDENAVPEPLLLLSQYNSFMSGYSGGSLRSEEYFSKLIREFRLPGALIKTTPEGCCAGYFEGERFTAYELYFNKGARGVLQNLLPSCSGGVSFALPCDMDIAPLLGDIPAECIIKAEDEPFCMTAPVKEELPACEAPAYCMDRY